MGVASQNDFESANQSGHEFRSLLAALRQAHQQLSVEMDKMDALTREPEPDRLRYANLRWKLSQASLTRRSLSARICLQLLPAIRNGDISVLSDIQAADRDLARKSAEHIGRWTTEVIYQRWADYCQASRQIRWQMSGHLEMEQRLLMPLVERAARLEK